MVLKTENFFKKRLLTSKISVLLASTFSVLVMGILGVVAINYNNLSDTLKENISFNLIINNDVPELETQQLIKSLTLLDGVKSVNFISKAQSAQELKENLGEDFLNILGKNPLKNIIEIRYFADFIENTSPIENIEIFNKYNEIEDVIYDEDIIFLLENNLQKLGLFFIIISIFFFMIAFILINSNIRLTIYSKRFIIKTMQLVGATKKFIQKPFLKSNLILTIIACLIGNFLLLCLLFLIINQIPEFKNFILWNQLIYLTIITSIINLTISLLSTLICVRKYLNLKTDELYK
ncbi:MAG: hypothetical protein CMP49_05255 [Flavobacteriales bacterium]|nr:hypothetical protein [Flavobacteriales bacterium]|tara:strand:+ start:1630 stop:2508 length:879 start_codon:yes stop_codon:yes gene_type:complete